MQLKQINTSSTADINKFINLPFTLYKDNKYWVPPLSSEMKSIFNRHKHPFYEHSKADFFIVENGKDVLGRVAVLRNTNYCEHHNINIAFFYYFDCIDDISVSSLLLDAVLEWSKANNVEEIYGPRGFTRSSGVGLLIEGFEYYPAIGIPYNFDYYGSQIEQAGFNKVTDYYSGYMNINQELPSKLYLVADKVKEKSNFWIKTFNNKSELKKFIPLVNKVHHDAFKNNPGYYPSTEKEFSMMAKMMIQAADPKLLKLIMKGEEVAGFIISYADISKALQRTKGRIWPFGWIDLLHEKKVSNVVNINGLGLLPQYQGLGSNALLYVELEKTIRQFDFEHAEIVQIDEQNFKSKSDSDFMGVLWHKKHRTYNLFI